MKRYLEQEPIRTGNLSTGAAAGMSSLADRLTNFQQYAREQSKRVAAAEGQEQAQQVEYEKVDGITQAPTKKKTGILDAVFTGGAEARAYNASLMDGYMASLENDIRLGLAELESQNADRITAFNEKADGFVKGVMRGVDPSIRQATSLFIDQQLGSARLRVQERTLKRNRDEANAARREAIDSAANQSATLARTGDQAGAAAAIQDAFSHVDGMLASGDMDKDQAASLKREIEREATEQGFRYRLDKQATDEGIDAAIAELDSIRNKVPGGWTPDEWDTFVRSARTELTRIKSQEEADQAKKSKDGQIALRQYSEALALGFSVDPQEKRRMMQLISGDPDLMEQYALVQNTSDFALMSYADRQAMMNGAETGQLGDVDQYGAFLTADAKINEMAMKDGYSLGVKQGLVPESPFDMNNPDSYTVRIDQARVLSEHYGVPVSPLTTGEAQGLAARLPGMTTPEKISLAMTLNQEPAVWDQIAANNGGTFAMAGASGDHGVMSLVFQGQEMLDTDTARLPSETDYLPAFQDYVEGIYGPQDAKMVKDAALAYYVASGQAGGDFDRGDFEAAVDAVTGGIAKVNGYKVELPRGVDEDRFDDFIDDIQPEYVARLGGVLNMSDEQAARAIRKGRIRNVKSNQYIVELDGGTLFTRAGTPLILEWSEENEAINQSFIRGPSRRTR